MPQNKKRKLPKAKKHQTGGITVNILSFTKACTKITTLIIALLELWTHIKLFFC